MRTYLALALTALAVTGCSQSVSSPNAAPSPPTWTQPAGPSQPVALEMCESAVAEWVKENKTSQAFGVIAYTQRTSAESGTSVTCKSEVIFTSDERKRPIIKKLDLLLLEGTTEIESARLSAA